jgi:MFS family permease
MTAKNTDNAFDEALLVPMPPQELSDSGVSQSDELVSDVVQVEKKGQQSIKLDKILFAVYFCTCVGSSLPVILLPLIAAEQGAIVGAGFSSAAFIAQVASIAALGGGFGKLINGFICQAIGGRALSSLYLLGITACTVLLSLGPTGTSVGWTLAGLEFFVSAQWPSCSLVLSNHFGSNPARFAAAITVLSLSSTAGTMIGKLGGTVLLPFVPSWRIAARFGASLTLIGAMIMFLLVSEYPSTAMQKQARVSSSPLSLKQIGKTLGTVGGSRLFWLAALAHSTTYLVRTSDRVLGALYQDTTGLPKSICGLLTASVTLGLVHGLGKGRGFQELPDAKSKTAVLKKNYFRSVLFTLGLGLFSYKKLATFLVPSNVLLAAVIGLLSGGMASSLAFQFYQIPPQIANTFGENKAVCLSFLDAAGFFMSFFAWGITGKLVGSLGAYGWSTTFVLLSMLFASGGILMSALYPEIDDRAKKAAEGAIA